MERAPPLTVKVLNVRPSDIRGTFIVQREGVRLGGGWVIHPCAELFSSDLCLSGKFSDWLAEDNAFLAQRYQTSVQMLLAQGTRNRIKFRIRSFSENHLHP